MTYFTKSIEVGTEAIHIKWVDDHESTFHFIWLRDNCFCNLCGAHNSGSRFQSFLDIPEDISPSNIESDSLGISIIWKNDKHESRFEYEWLRKHCYSTKEKTFSTQTKTLWNGNLTDFPIVNYQLASEDDTELYKLFSSVSEYGFVIVKNVGTDPNETLKLAEMLGYIRNTHFGLVGDLILRTNGKHIADFPTDILPHTDETYRSVPIGINIFHCIQPSDNGGGDSILVDSHYCANEFASQFPELYSILSKVPIQHERITNGEIIRSNHPVFTVNTEGNIMEVRLNERTMCSISVQENEMQQVYKALRQIFKIAYNKENRIRFQLESGDALIFDNLRVLHGRTAFTGNRHLRQTNVIRDEFYAKMTFLKEVKLTSKKL